LCSGHDEVFKKQFDDRGIAMKYVLIGCGRIARNHIEAAKRNGLEIAAICDISAEKAREFHLVHSLPDSTEIYTDYREMCRALRPELAAIATESGKHASIALELIEQGINLIIEKPIAMSINDADAIVQRSREKNVVVSACHQNRFNLAVQATRKSLVEGRFGKLSHGSVNIRWNRCREYYEQASWRGTWAQDGGCLMNQCIHGIDLLRWMFGDGITEVYGTIRQQSHDFIEAEDVGIATIKFKNGAIGTIEGTVNVFPQNLEETLCLFGTDGTVKLGGTSCNAVEHWCFRNGVPSDTENRELTEITGNVYGNGHSSLYADVLHAIEAGRSPLVDAEAGRNALEVVLAIYKSAKENKPIQLPLKDFSSMDMQGFFG